MENLYEILQVNENASNEVIENAYKALVKKYHPDISKDKKKAEDIMKKINNAHDILSDENKKAKYDESLRIERERNIQSNNRNLENEIHVQYNENTNINNSAKENNIKYSDTSNNNNKYDKEYDNYYDYINNYNIFSRIRYLSSQTKKIIAVIILIVLFLIIRYIFWIKDLFISNEEIGDNTSNNQVSDSENKVTTSKNNENVSNKEIEKDENVIIKINECFKDIKQSNIYNFNNCLTGNTKIANEKIKAFENDKSIYNLILNSLGYEVLDYSMTNENESNVSLKLERIDIENILNDYVSSKIFSGGFNSIYDIQISKSELINILKDTQEIKEINDKFKLVKIDNEWKINLTNSNIKSIFGTNLGEKEFELEY